LGEKRGKGALIFKITKGEWAQKGPSYFVKGELEVSLKTAGELKGETSKKKRDRLKSRPGGKNKKRGGS